MHNTVPRNHLLPAGCGCKRRHWGHNQEPCIRNALQVFIVGIRPLCKAVHEQNHTLGLLGSALLVGHDTARHSTAYMARQCAVVEGHSVQV